MTQELLHLDARLTRTTQTILNQIQIVHIRKDEAA